MNFSKKEISSIYVVFAILIGVFSFYDLPFSLMLYNPQSNFGELFAGVGVVPLFIISGFSCFLFSGINDKTTKKTAKLWFFTILGILLILGASGVVFYYYDSINIPLILIIFAILLPVVLWLVSQVDNNDSKTTKAIGKVGILTALSAVVLINIIKIIWGRPRLKAMTNPLEEYVPWYLPQKLATSDNIKSFPSGHTANATLIVWITYLPYLYRKLRNSMVVMKVVSVVFVLVVALSRIVLGAHFATDVLWGGALSFTLFLIISRTQKKNIKQLD